MIKMDLHIHSNYSDDGEVSPKEIIERSKEQGLKLISITDHNSVKGVEEAITYAEKLKVISGVELDCTCQGKNFHLLGYGFNYKDNRFREIEMDILRQEQEASEEKIRLFRLATGIPISTLEVFSKAKDGVVTGELIGEILFGMKNADRYELLRPYLPGGAKSDMPNVHFYWDFFSEGKIAYVPIRYLTLKEATELIHETGGVAVLAHPRQNLPDKEIFPAIFQAGIDGIEAFSSYHDRKTAEYYWESAKNRQLFVTAGSDFHGKHKPKISLGGHGASLTESEEATITEQIIRYLGF